MAMKTRINHVKTRINQRLKSNLFFNATLLTLYPAHTILPLRKSYQFYTNNINFNILIQ